LSKRSRPPEDEDSTDITVPQQRTVGMTEAGIGLSLITCLLVALGYVIIQRLGDRGRPSPREVAPIASPLTPNTTQPTATNGIVPVGPSSEPTGGTAYQTSYPPQWLPPQQDSSGADNIRSAQRPDNNRAR
jgi:hypothetical protein